MKESFLAELQRRNVLRAGAFYAAAAWLLVKFATQDPAFLRLVVAGEGTGQAAGGAH
jgi:hypothetical protein